ncbi:MAG: PIG-L family deacetylase [Gemmatales bacterium]|nr:PIG-L family deacetylase [Gemmatales bacterium]
MKEKLGGNMEFQPASSSTPLRLLIIGAHPDDCEYHAGGLATYYRQFGHVVKMVSVTNGQAGHHEQPGPRLAARRRQEFAAACAVIGAECEVGTQPDGELLPTLENRLWLIRLIRRFRPDLVLTHRPNDYHPDHRYTSQLVQDAAYLVTVPAIASDVPHLPRDPVICYLPDEFQKPYPFRAAVAIDVGPVVSTILEMLHCHQSQFYEWLPYNTGQLHRVPREDAARRQWLAEQILPRLRRQAERCRDLLIQAYGPQHGARVEYAEVFEPCEYGAPLDEAAKERLFGFIWQSFRNTSANPSQNATVA